MKRDSFIFYGSFREAARALDDATRLALYDAIADYGLYDEMPEAASPLVQALFTLIRPQLEANARRREAGRMGGRPTRESRDPQTPSSGSSGTAELPSVPKAAPAEKPVDTVLSCHAKPVVSDPVQKQKPNVTVNENVNANENENINVHANVNTTAHDRQRPEQYALSLRRLPGISPQVCVKQEQNVWRPGKKHLPSPKTFLPQTGRRRSRTGFPKGWILNASGRHIP